MEFSDTFWKHYDVLKEYPTIRYINSCGGARSSKTFSILQLLYLLAMNDTTPTLTSVVSETLPHLKRGAIRDFCTITGTSEDMPCWNKSDHIFTLSNGSKIEFFSADSPSKMLGPARDRLFVNESNHIPHETFRQLATRTRGLIIYDYNPTADFWGTEIYPLRDNCKSVHSTYKDNRFLPKAQVAEIEANKSDENWWRVYGLGLVGRLEGVIFPDFEQVDELPEYGIELYGMDFGFTNDPSVIMKVKLDTGRKEIWADEIGYGKGLLNSDLIDILRKNGVGRTTPIFADCAEPKTIEEIHRAGFNCLPSYKATRKAEQLQMMKGYKLYVTKRSVNVVRELRCYTWAQDKDGKLLNEPIGTNDHTMDALRYAVGGYIYGNYKNRGKYAISIR